MPTSTDTLTVLAELSRALEPPQVGELSDDELLAGQRAYAEVRRKADSGSAVFAAEIARRSARNLGQDGLAQRLGARTPEILVQRVTGTNAREAGTLVRVGALMAAQQAADEGGAGNVDAAAGGDAARESHSNAAPWLREIGRAVGAGRLSIEAADVIRAGLGTLDDVADPVTLVAGLTEAAAVLLAEAGSLTVERLAARARALRNELDVEGVLRREEERRERRYLRLIPRADGMTALDGLLDPESAATVTAAYDAATSPRRGGPRFVDPEAKRRAEELLADPRTTGQIALDTFVDLIQLATKVDAGQILGSRRPAVRMLVTERDLRERHGMAWIEGQSDAVSIHTAERHICDCGVLPILFSDDDGRALNSGRQQRLHSARQRVVIGARDGGCMVDGCDRPPSWTEVHHPEEWDRDGGETSVENGILLCRFHHQWVHNRGWRVIRRGAEYYLVPPRDVDPDQVPILMRSRSAAYRRLCAG